MSESVEFPVTPPSPEAQAIADAITKKSSDLPITAVAPSEEAQAIAAEIMAAPPGTIARTGAYAENPAVAAMKAKMYRRD